MTPAPRPPWIARRLLAWLLPPDVREAIGGDLEEVFVRDCRDHGRLTALVRFWRKTASFGVHFLGERVSGRIPRPSLMDLKLGFRLLVRYPGLSIVGSLGMAFALAIGAAAFEFLNQVVSPTLPLADGQRIVGVQLWHSASNSVETQTLWEYSTWRGRLQTIDSMGAFRSFERNLVGTDAPGEPILTAEMTASALALAGVPALHGRTLIDADEEPGAPAVVLIGHDVWQVHFGGDPGVVGRTVQVGTVPRTIVGVMPEDFGFPESHSLWTPLRLSDLEFDRRQGPGAYLVGRLAPGASFADAQAELTALGQRTAAAFPETHEHIQPQVVSYAELVSPILRELPPVFLRSINLFFVLLLVLVCANVALLMFARAASRQGELIVRAALGASRRRISGQLFAEALALGSVALMVGLSAAGFVLRWWQDVIRAEDHGRLPFWYSETLAPATIVYAALLMVAGAAIAGVVPALKATRRTLDRSLRESTAGGGGLQFGGIWTVVIVAQVALTVAFPAATYFVRQEVSVIRSLDAGFAADQYLSAALEIDLDYVRGDDGVIRTSFPAERYGASARELARRLITEPGVAGVTFADRLPRAYHPLRRIELAAGSGAAIGEGLTSARAGTAAVAIDFFDVLDAPIRAGRAFTSSDLESRAQPVIVNEAFVSEVLQGRAALGRQLRELSGDPEHPTRGPWLEVAGVAPNLGVITGNAGSRAAYYRPADPGTLGPTNLIVHVRGGAPDVATRLHQIAAEVDPGVRVHGLASMGRVNPTMWMEFDFLGTLLTVVSAIALLLSLASTYAAMSFAVSRRRREIGIRVTLGADAARIAAATFSRPVVQVGAGVALGSALTAALAVAVAGGTSAGGAGRVAAYAVLMLAVCLLPLVTPLRRALRVDPVEALRADT